MDEPNTKTLKQEDKTRKDLTIDNASPSRKHNVDIAALVRSLHEDPSLRTRDESTNTHYVSRFVLKVNNTLSVTKVSLNKGPKKPQDLEAHTLKAQTNEVKTTGVKRIKDITKLAKELEERQEKLSLEGDTTSFNPDLLQDQVAAGGQGYPRPTGDEILRRSVVETKKMDPQE